MQRPFIAAYPYYSRLDQAVRVAKMQAVKRGVPYVVGTYRKGTGVEHIVTRQHGLAHNGAAQNFIGYRDAVVVQP